MEVNKYQQSKKLHYHALPLIIISVAYLLVSVAFAAGQYTNSTNEVAISHSLFSPTLHVSHTATGAVHVTVNSSPRSLSPDFMQGGRTSDIDFSLNK